MYVLLPVVNWRCLPELIKWLNESSRSYLQGSSTYSFKIHSLLKIKRIAALLRVPGK